MKSRQGNSRFSSSALNIFVIASVSIILWWILRSGRSLEALLSGIQSAGATQNQSAFWQLDNAINLHHPLSILILQILVIILVSRMLGWLMSLINQPTVIGEIMAGIMLGPSLLGLYFPEVTLFLFPIESLGNLQFLSQIGLILFMFIIGMELDIGLLRQKAKAAVFISNSSIVVPFVLGAALSLFLFVPFAGSNARFVPFALFMGIAMSITAFPVLARIVQERGLTRTPLGMTAITCAAINDITAWGILAIVVAIANASALGGALITILLSLVYVALMLLVIRPLLNKVAHKYTVRETISKPIVAVVLSTMLISAWITEVIGIHALFGAFMAGVIIPDNARFKQIMAEKIEDVSLVLLLPLFFVYTGLRTQIGLLNEPGLWLIALAVTAVAVTGKFAGSAIAARITGQSWKDSLLIGALMNTRGLIELIALNIGYDIGVLSPEIFTILVLMALVTTLMTGPAMAIIHHFFPEAESERKMAGTMKILVAFGPPEAGGRLTQLAGALRAGLSKSLKITALHLTPNTEISLKNARMYEDEAFKQVKEIASKTKLSVKTLYRTSEMVSQEIIKTANRGKFDLLLVGSSRPLLGQDETGGKARYFFDNAKCDVGLLIDKGFKDIQHVLVIMGAEDEDFLFGYCEGLNKDCKVKYTCLLPLSVPLQKTGLSAVQAISLKDEGDNFAQYDLIISTLSNYRYEREAAADWVDGEASILLIKKRGQD